MGMTDEDKNVNKTSSTIQAEVDKKIGESHSIKFVEIKSTSDLLNKEGIEFPIKVCVYLENCPPCHTIYKLLQNSTFNKNILLYRVNLMNDSFIKNECKILAAPPFVKLDKVDGELKLISKNTFANITKFCDFFDVVVDDDF